MRYLINRKTNEHERYDGQNYDATKYRIVEADSEGWIKHEGNECPLPEDVLCEARVRTGKTAYSVPVKASSLYWEQTGMPGNIIAYRPILAEKAQEPEPVVKDSLTTDLLNRLKAAHEAAQTIPDLEAELREVLGSMGYDLVARSPFVEPEDYAAAIAEPEPAVEAPQEEMSDWRNWREGDVIARIKKIAPYWREDFYVLHRKNYNSDSNALGIFDGDGDFRPLKGLTNFVKQNFRFHSRPAKGEK